MSSIYAIQSNSIPDFEILQSALSSLYEVKSLDSVEALGEFKAEKGVVLLGGAPSQMNVLTGMVRSIAPKLACIGVVESALLGKLSGETFSLMDILSVPAEAIEIQTRVNTAMHITELRQVIEASAQLDEVTELYNSHYFIKRLGEEMALSKRHLSPVTCMILSIAFYDIYLDSYGHQFVYDIIERIAKVVKQHIRQEDLAARLSGNEVGLLLPHSSEKGALCLAERLAVQIEKLSVKAGSEEEQLEVKIGIAGFPNPSELEMDPDSLVRYGRHALHTARCSETRKIQLFSEMRPFVG